MPTLADHKNCTGCTACASVCPQGCISMLPDKFGFPYPVVDENRCINCKICESACPIVTPLGIKKSLPKAYAAFSNNMDLRMQSSSGGVFSEIAKEILEDGGVVFGAAYSETFGVVHICVNNDDDLARLRGAKYAQSDLVGVFTQVKQRLDVGQKVLFSGTPCQAAGLKAFLGKEYSNLLTIDFVCHSVPSPMAWKEYVRYRAKCDNQGELPKEINLRSKESGWSRYQYSNCFTYENGKVHTTKSNKSVYMKMFVNGYFSRESCYSCHFKGYSRISDLTIGDFWGIWDLAPEMDDNRGTSVVLAHSESGKEMIMRIKERITVKPVSLEETSIANNAMTKPLGKNTRRKLVLACIKQGHEAIWDILKIL